MVRNAVRLFFTFNVVLLVMLAVSLPFQEPGTETYVVSVVSLAVVVGSLVVSGLYVYLEDAGAPDRPL